MSKASTERMTKKSAQVMTRSGAMSTHPQTRSNTGPPSNINRSPSLVELNFDHPSLVSTAKDGQSYLETQLLLVPEGAPVTLANLSATLFQISALAKIPREAIQAICAVTWLLDKVEGDAVAATA
ncbi:hypothetical protein BYT27DRAFT_7252108 [Phlegmacium glaucopus]|nr:hypothetical protein BYT27DRAFT_7252108 [Phlegmacium glaucopus]